MRLILEDMNKVTYTFNLPDSSYINVFRGSLDGKMKELTIEADVRNDEWIEEEVRRIE